MIVILLGINIGNRAPNQYVVDQCGGPGVVKEDSSSKRIFDLTVPDQPTASNIEQSNGVIPSVFSKQVLHSHIVYWYIIRLSNLPQGRYKVNYTYKVGCIPEVHPLRWQDTRLGLPF